MASSGKRPRKPKRPLPPIPKYVRYPRDGYRWRLGGPLTRDHEAQAEAAERKRAPGPIGRFVLRVLGGRKEPRSR
jgi:hypothetical protein